MASGFKLRFPGSLGSAKSPEKCPENPDLVLKRTPRNRSKPKRYGDFLELTPNKQRLQDELESTDDEQIDGDLCLQKPTALFSSDDVEGQDMYKFKSRHTKQDLQNKVKELISSSPKVDSPLKTPKKFPKGITNSLKKESEVTPKHVKDVIKQRIIREVESDSAESDFSGSSTDFVPEGSDNESSSSSSSEGEQEPEPKKATRKQQVDKNKDKTRIKDSEYFVTPDNYFMMNSTKKWKVKMENNANVYFVLLFLGQEIAMDRDKFSHFISKLIALVMMISKPIMSFLPVLFRRLVSEPVITTSDHTLSRLKNLNVQDSDEVVHLSAEHNEKINKLNQSYTHYFDRWLFVLSENFSVILYGIGSKRAILHQFQIEKLNNFPCIVVNGFFPSLTIKSILETIVVDLLENSHVPSNIGDVVNLIDTQLTEYAVQLFLIIHNIDGTMLRSNKAQSALASLSQIKNVHTIATIDHINAPLLWDHAKLSKFKFTWWDVTTFQPYTEETSFENSLMSHRSGALQLSSLRSVFQSLTTNAKGIFNIIIQYQLENQKQSQYQGLPFKDLYSKCREQFLVSSDLALRAQLTEFFDHKLVKMKRTFDGSENLVIPIDNVLLQQFLEQQES